MLGNLPQDFLRIQVTQAQIYDPTGYGMRQGYSAIPQQQLNQNPNFLGYFTLTINEVIFVLLYKNHFLIFCVLGKISKKFRSIRSNQNGSIC
jgi:hypothetical protein